MPTDDRLSKLRQAVAEPLSHPDVTALRSYASEIMDWAITHYETLPGQGIGNTATPDQLRTVLPGVANERPKPLEEILSDFQSSVSPNAFRVNHPRFLAFVPGAPCFPSILGDWLASAANFFCGVWLEASGPAQIESTVLDWFRQWIGMPESTRGVLTSGGSEANLLALVVARERLSQSDRDRAVLYVAEQRHWSIDRAAMVIGLRKNQVRPVPVDGEFRLRREELHDQMMIDRERGQLPWAVVANAGATNTGTVDALVEIGALCREERVWLHIDAAYGWAAALTLRGRREVAGIDLGDSITLDPHKWLAQAFDVGCVLVRDGRLLPETFAMRPDYLQDVTPNEGEVNYADHGIALTRRFRALKVWLSVEMLGVEWFRRLAEHCIGLADYAQARIESTGQFEVLCERRLSIVCFRFVHPHWSDDLDSLNTSLLVALRDSGRAFLSSTKLRGAFAIRMCFVNWRTTAADVDEIVELLVKFGTEIATGQVVPNVPPSGDAGSAGNATNP